MKKMLALLLVAVMCLSFAACDIDALMENDTGYAPNGLEYRINEDNPVMAVVKQGNEGVIAVAYDDIKSIEYFKKQCDAYYKINGDTFFDVCKKECGEGARTRHRVKQRKARNNRYGSAHR